MVMSDSWMKDLPNEKSIASLSIPGTHDSGTYLLNANNCIAQYAKTQIWNFTSQLNVGVRFLDIRCRHINNAFAIHHDALYLHLNFDNVLVDCINFLADHPSETIIMQVKKEYNSEGFTRSFYSTFMAYVNKYGRDNFYLEGTIPTLGSVRGKIVIINRFDSGVACGIPMSYKDNATFRVDNMGNGQIAYVQDNYEITVDHNCDAKWSNITNCFVKARANQGDGRVWYINYTSGAGTVATSVLGARPDAIAEVINKKVAAYFASNPTAFFGTVVMDFINYPSRSQILNRIINQNYKL